MAAVDEQIEGFNGTLIWSFLLLGLGLVLAVFLQVRIGLLPLRQVATALARIRDGSAQRLEGNFPAELAPLASSERLARTSSATPVRRTCSRTGPTSASSKSCSGMPRWPRRSSTRR